jgi:citrate lyase beta subunit
MADNLTEANLAFARHHPGESAARQPVHTVYGGGHLFRADTAPKLGQIALRVMDEYASRPHEFGRTLGLEDDTLAAAVEERVREKLHREPVEDYRIDFEDGYGARSDTEEDGHVIAAAGEVARGLRERLLPAFIGIRIKPLNEEWKRRATRTLDLFLRTVIAEGPLPPGFIITLPKITVLEQVRFVAAHLASLEPDLGLADRSLRFEIMVETPQMIMDSSGRCPLPSMIDAGDGRISAAHFGTYDYSASLGVAAAHQRMRHDACQHALRVMQVALAGTGVWVSDGATTVLPVPVHRAGPDGASAAAGEQNRAAVHRAWRSHYDDVRHSLANALYQGWDLHPAQLPTRYAAVYAFFLEGVDAAALRLRNFVDHAARATLVGDVFDDAATGQGLLNYFLRAVSSGALSLSEVAERSGLTTDELTDKSFVRILRARGSARVR